MNLLDFYEGKVKLNYGRDTGLYNRARVRGFFDTFAVIAARFGTNLATRLMAGIPLEVMLIVLNTDTTADTITIRED